MSSAIPEALFQQISDFLAARIGLYYPQSQWIHLHRSLRQVASDLGFHDVGTCMKWLMAGPLTSRQIDVLTQHLTIGETYFFRDRPVFTALEQHILPELLKRPGKSLRIWSAGCCTGEEPYSLAILINRLMPIAGPKVDILGTDINTASLARARAGIYRNWSFRNPPEWLLDGYFSTTTEGYRVLDPLIRAQVNFSYLNLANDPYPSPENATANVDLILCRNVLMYFKPERMRHIVEHFHHCLNDGGWLIVSPAEVSPSQFADFHAEIFPGAILYRKEAASHTSLRNQLLPNAARLQQHTRPARLQEAPVSVSRSGSVRRATLSGNKRPSLPAAAVAADPAATAQAAPVSALRIAQACANQGQLAEALSWSDQAVAVHKLDPQSHYLRGNILQEQGRLEEAAAALRRALYLDQDFLLAHVALGNVAQRQGRRRVSARHFANAVQLLQRYPREEVLPELDGMTAGRLLEILQSHTLRGVHHDN